MDQPKVSLTWLYSIHRLQYANFVLQVKNAADEATTGVYIPCCQMQWRLKLIETVNVSSNCKHSSHYIRKNFAWWAVTRRTSQTAELSKLGGWALAQGWAFAWDNTVH